MHKSTYFFNTVGIIKNPAGYSRALGNLIKRNELFLFGIGFHFILQCLQLCIGIA